MERLLICIFIILCFISASIGRKGFGPGEQEWGYVQVRPYANMFWWLYYTTADVKSYYDKPLVIWLQGGPGGSSTAYGNFEELGPLDTDLNPRNYTWVKDYNILFIDNPVGAGFSYAQNKSQGMVDTADFNEINAAANSTKDKIEKGQWTEALIDCSYTQAIISEKTCNVDVYNILTKKKCNSSLVSPQNVLLFDEDMYRNFVQIETQSLESLMNGPVKKALGLNVTHGNQSQIVRKSLIEDIMKPVTNIVDELLNETNLNVFVYNGQLDLIIDTPGTLLWVEKLEWAQWWKWLPREPLLSEDGFLEGSLKFLDKFCMYWVHRAGHMVPKDNPAAMKVILQNLTNNAYN
ncbi:retinoid-inducible serine carboxypeptidase-like [Formica exsecta]|uniref:retinoid-inducible serine carboxypeptidase-like n=1 Tax=Formica exsecta TaxID=72781 RepID=UPI0011451963|nr:retinoid-inducible serine carboxypeptidase-like [Formica exsecta]